MTESVRALDRPSRRAVAIWGPCGHNWLDFACYAAGALNDEIEVRAVEVQAVTCAADSEELGDHLEVAGLIYEAVDVAHRQQPVT